MMDDHKDFDEEAPQVHKNARSRDKVYQDRVYSPVGSMSSIHRNSIPMNSFQDTHFPTPNVRGHEEVDSHDNACARFFSHMWFLFACCGFLIFSSLPRILTVLDFVCTSLLYLLYVRGEEGGHSVGRFIRDEFNHYKFQESVISVVILSFLRSALLFFCFAYRFHTNQVAYLTALGIVCFSFIWLCIKLAANDNMSSLPVIIFSLFMNFFEIGVYLMVRRTRITVPNTGRENSHLLYNKSESYHTLVENRESPVPKSTSRPTLRQVDMRRLSLDATHADPDSQFLSVDRINVHYKTRGNGSQAIVFLHGFGGSTWSWMSAIDQMESPDFTLITFDRPGFGFTSRPINGDWVENPYRHDFQAALVFKLLDHLQFEKAIIVGHDSGGALGVTCALRVPQRVQGLVLVAPSIYTETFPKLIRSMFRTKLGKSVIMQLVRTEIGEVALRRGWYNPKNIPEDVLIRHKAMLRVPAFHEALIEMANLNPPSVSAYLFKVICPIIAVHGVEDKLIDISETRKACESFSQNNSNVHLLPIEHSGHVPHEEQTQEFVEGILPFLEEMKSFEYKRP